MSSHQSTTTTTTPGRIRVQSASLSSRQAGNGATTTTPTSTPSRPPITTTSPVKTYTFTRSTGAPSLSPAQSKPQSSSLLSVKKRRGDINSLHPPPATSSLLTSPAKATTTKPRALHDPYVALSPHKSQPSNTFAHKPQLTQTPIRSLSHPFREPLSSNNTRTPPGTISPSKRKRGVDALSREEGGEEEEEEEEEEEDESQSPMASNSPPSTPSSTTKSITHYTTQIATLEDSLTHLQAQYKNLLGQNETLLEDYSTVTESTHSQSQLLESAQERITKIDHEYNDLFKAHQITLQTIAQLEREKAGILATSTQVRSELDSLKLEMARQLQRYSHETTSQYDDNISVVTQLTSKIDLLEAKLQGVTGARDELDLAYKDLRAEFDALLDEQSHDDNELNVFELTKTIEVLRKSHQQDREKLLQKHHTQIQSYENTVLELENEIDALEVLKDEQLEQIDLLLSENRQYQLKLNDERLDSQDRQHNLVVQLKTDIERHQIEATRYKEQIDRLHSTSGDSSSRTRDLELDLTKIKFQCDEMGNGLKSKEFELKVMESQYHSVLAKFEKNEILLNEARGQVMEARIALAQRSTDSISASNTRSNDYKQFQGQLALLRTLYCDSIMDHHAGESDASLNEGDNGAFITAIDTFLSHLAAQTDPNNNSNAAMENACPSTPAKSSSFTTTQSPRTSIHSATAMVTNARNERLKQQHQQYRTEITALKAQLSDAETKSGTLQQKHDALAGQFDQINSDLNSLQADEVKMKKQLAVQSSIIQKYHAELQTFTLSTTPLTHDLSTLSTTSYSPIIKSLGNQRNSFTSTSAGSAVVSATTPTLFGTNTNNTKNTNLDNGKDLIDSDIMSALGSTMSASAASSFGFNSPPQSQQYSGSSIISFSQSQVEAIRGHFKAQVDKSNAKLEQKASKYQKVKEDYKHLLEKYQALLESTTTQAQQYANQQHTHQTPQHAPPPSAIKPSLVRSGSSRFHQAQMNLTGQPTNALALATARTMNVDECGNALSLMDTISLDNLMRNEFKSIQPCSSTMATHGSTMAPFDHVTPQRGRALRHHANGTDQYYTNNNNNNYSHHSQPTMNFHDGSLDFNLSSSSSNTSSFETSPDFMNQDDKAIFQLTASLTQRFPQGKMVTAAGSSGINHSLTDQPLNENNNTNQTASMFNRGHPITRHITQTDPTLATLATHPSAQSFNPGTVAGFDNTTQSSRPIASPSKRFIPRVSTAPSKALTMTTQALGGGKPFTNHLAGPRPSMSIHLHSQLGPVSGGAQNQTAGSNGNQNTNPTFTANSQKTQTGPSRPSTRFSMRNFGL